MRCVESWRDDELPFLINETVKLVLGRRISDSSQTSLKGSAESNAGAIFIVPVLST